jgi:hypothetical protein
MDISEDKLNEALDRNMVDVLSESQMREIGREFISSSDIRKLLSKHDIPHMVVGAHALGEITGEPRATQDVDIIVKQDDYDRTIEIIQKRYGLRAEGNRIKDKEGNVLVDVLTDDHPIYATAMETGDRSPSPEMILVMKFLAGINPLRRVDKKYMDRADFYNLLRHADIDENRVMELLRKADPEYALHQDELRRWLNADGKAT